MRLQLIVQRHSLPPVYVIWTVGVLRPPHAAAGSSATVSHLLEQVNEIIPLESDDWGLEDYAVEVGGFECLHFFELNQVLKEDDEVSIRPLQTSDLRFRKLSGRHQISADGKHLIDGVAFGRPFLRQTARPPVRIPPRKRRRVTYVDDGGDNDDDVDVYFSGRQVEVRGDDLIEEDSDDDDFSDQEDEIDDLSAELEDLRNDIYNDTNEEKTSPTHDSEVTSDRRELGGLQPSLRESRKLRKGLGLNGAGMLKLLDENGRPYPGEYSNPLLDFYDQQEPVQKANKPRPTPSSRTRKSCRSSRFSSDGKGFSGSLGQLRRQSSSASMNCVRFEDIDSTTPATIREFEILDQSDDRNLEPTADTIIEPDESDKENSQPRLGDHELAMSPSISSESSSSGYESVDDETSSSSPSSSSASSGSESGHFPSSSKAHAGARQTSSESSSKSASFNSRVEKSSEHSEYLERGSNEPRTLEGAVEQSPTGLNMRSSNPPFQGLARTRRRNQRRRRSLKLRRLKYLGILSPDAGFPELRDNKRSGEMEDHLEDEHEESVHITPSALLSAKKDSLLKAIGLNSTALTQEPTENKSTTEVDVSSPLAGTEIIPKPRSDPMMDRYPEKMEDVQQTINEEIISEEPNNILTNTETPERRSKLDLSSSRRLLFGSLGLQIPKTRDDEEKIRAKLRENIKSMPELKSQAESECDKPLAVSAEDDDTWRDRIILKAVECCDDGIELSTPPFPFVQRWDPQQQKPHPKFPKTKASNRGKKRKRNNGRYPVKDFRYKTDEGVAEQNESAQPGTEIFFNEDNAEHLFGGSERITSLRDDGSNNVNAASEQQTAEKEVSVTASIDIGIVEDLPNLPEDISMYPPLEEDAVKSGAVIAFKQLDMSEATNWQPKVSDYRTALIDCLTDDKLIKMVLAKRDQSEDGGGFNSKPRSKAYSKFEMPGFDDDNNGPQNKQDLEISFSELIQPKLVQAAKAGSIQEGVLDSIPQDGGLSRDTNSFKLENIETMPINAKPLNPEQPTTTFQEHTVKGASEEIRQEILEIIKDAGWRSSLRSNESETVAEPRRSISPASNGPSSSPPLPKKVVEKALKTEIVKESAASRLTPPQQSDTIEIAESLPAQRITISESSLHNPSYTGENTDVKEEYDIENDIWSKAQHESSNNSDDNQPLPISSETSTRRSATGKITARNRDPQTFSNTSSFAPDAQSSDNEFPTLENVFSQIRSSQAQSSFEPSSSVDEDLSYIEQSSSEPTKSRGAGTKRGRDGEMRYQGNHNVSQKSTLLRWDESDIEEDIEDDAEEDERIPRASQAPVQSRIVDLTVSSDPVDQNDQSDDSEYVDDETQLPSGPGWVKKNRTRLGKFNTCGTGSRKISRSTSTEAF